MGSIPCIEKHTVEDSEMIGFFIARRRSMSWRKSKVITRLEVLAAAARDNKQEETAKILLEIRYDMDNIWEISDIVAKAKAGKATLGGYEFGRRVDDMSETLYKELNGTEDFQDLDEDVQERYRRGVRAVLSLLE